MKNYAIMRIAKLKSSKQFADAYKHNTRIYDVTNADPSRLKDNEEAVELNGQTYEQAYHAAIAELKMAGVPMPTIRKDAVRGFEVVLRYSPEADAGMDHAAWVDANIAWLREAFNPPGGMIRYINKETGEACEREIDNVKSVIVHNDEGTPHIHAYIVPIDERGRLCADSYIGNRAKLIELQNAYAKAMKQFGLERGEYYSVATPEQVSRYYKELKNPLEQELPEVLPGESAEAYRDRANAVYQNAGVHHRDEIVKKNQEIIRAKSEAFLEKVATDAPETEARKFVRKMKDVLQSPDLDDAALERIRKAVVRQKDFKRGLELSEDSSKAASAEALYSEFADIGRRDRLRNRRKKKLKTLPDEKVNTSKGDLI